MMMAVFGFVWVVIPAMVVLGNAVPLDGVLRSATDGSEEAYLPPPFASNHASTLEVLPDGSLVAAWFSGAHEEANKCAIVVAKLDISSNQWSKAAVVSMQDGFSNQNPVLYYDGGVLHLFHSHAPANDGEGSSEIWHLQSTDGSRTWSDPAPYITNPGAFPRNRVLPRHDRSGILLPMYNASKKPGPFGSANYAIMALTSANISNISLYPVQASAQLVQPSVVRLPSQTSPPPLMAFFRDRRAQHVYKASSADDGITWTDPIATSILNNNAGIEANILTNASIVLVYNPTTSERDPLAISLFGAAGATVLSTRYLQHGNSTAQAGLEFSYPSVLQTSNGVVHVTYTYNRECIKYKRFNVSWIGQT